ncbi:Aste57867_13604 [Aphanomyces stellatus]|uniref:Aste57867_13604 protein n=1 Tax=Aphanomyces stellatus TaxID=120398 RepID=A0A485KYH5_9STRA|nr:hypothetical protein As57867_013554 [Aphanomyces stellatus]VFT90441.1 Aste57867_13604 [Aphanomyces stellatus]
MRLLQVFQAERPSLPCVSPAATRERAYTPSKRLSKEDISALFDEPTVACTPRTSAQRRQLAFERDLEKSRDLVRRTSTSGWRRHRRSTSIDDDTAKRLASEASNTVRCGKAFHFVGGELIDVKASTRRGPFIPLDEYVGISYAPVERHSFNGTDSILEELIARQSLPPNFKY